jgi:hypothetical protein
MKMQQDEYKFEAYLRIGGLSKEIQNRYPPELTRLKQKGFDFFLFNNNSSDTEINATLERLISVGGTPVIYDVGEDGKRVPNNRNPKNYDSAELVIRVIKLYLLHIGKATGNPNDIKSILPTNDKTLIYLQFLEGLKKQYNKLFEIFENISSQNISIKPIKTNNNSASKGVNKIYYGVPGSGKSHHLKTLIDDIFDQKFIQRTVFYPDYSYSDFVGQILPLQEQATITYKFKPGIFTKILLDALLDPDNQYYLIIEELNRGNASSIFGDLFQLLDRSSNGDSIYPISNIQIQEFLSLNIPNRNKFDLVKLPSNLSIYATMNTSDQNVFVMDTAFKRRWSFELIPNDITKFPNAIKLFIPNTLISWQEFHTKINKKIVENQEINSNFDDKQIGPFFVDKNCLSMIPNDKDQDLMNKFAYKVLEYLWNDVTKLNRNKWFGPDIKTLEDLIFSYKTNGFEKLPNKLID